jgi:hypothetical protein
LGFGEKLTVLSRKRQLVTAMWRSGIHWPARGDWITLPGRMNLISSIRLLVSLPLLWCGQVAGMFQMPASIPLLKAAWRVSADGQVGLKALTAVSNLGEGAEAIGCALAWIEKYPRVELTSYAGLLAANAGLDDIARNMLIMSQQLGRDKLGLTEMLEFTIAKRYEPLGAACDCARRLETRNDLSPTVSVMVSTELLWEAMLIGRLDEAKRRAEHMLSVGVAPVASVAMAAMASKRGDLMAAAKHMEHAKLPPVEMHYYRFLAACGIGADDEAREQHERLGEYNASLAEYATRQVAAMRGSR